MRIFKNTAGVFAYDLTNQAQCEAAIERFVPQLHQTRVSAAEALKAWHTALHAEKTWVKQRQAYDEWVAHKASYDAWVLAADPEATKVSAPSPEPQAPGERPPAPGERPSGPPALSAQDVIAAMLSAGLEDVTGSWPPQPSRADQTARAWALIKAERDRRSDLGGFSVTVDGVKKWFHSDTKSRSQQTVLVMAGSAIPAAQWKTMDGSFVAMTQTLAQQLLASAMIQEMQTFAKAEQHKAAMMQSENPLQYDFSEGWPEIYVQEAA